jgi:hypothetical protein
VREGFPAFRTANDHSEIEASGGLVDALA